MIAYKRYTCGLFVLIAVLLFLGYRPAFNAPFVFDDLPNIVDNRMLHLDHFSPAELKPLFKGNRVLVNVSFALNYYFGRLNPFGYHLVNLLIHLAATIILYFLVETLLLGTSYQSQSFPVAATVSLLFACHPVQTQAVTYIVQRASSLAALSFFLCVLAYLQGRRTSGRTRFLWLGLSGLSAACAFASKENSATLPLFVLLAEVCFRPGNITRSHNHGGEKQKLQKGKSNLRWQLLAGGLGIVLLLGFFHANFDLNKLLAGYRIRSFTMGHRLLTQPRVIVHYLTLLFWPLSARLNLDYDFPVSFSFLNPPATLVCLTFLLVLVGLSFYLAGKDRLIAFSIWWYLGNLVIESSIIPLEMVFEHRLYLPSAGIFLLFGLLFARVRKRFILKNSLGGILVLSFLLTWGTYQRNQVWAKELTLWQDTVRKSPDKARPHVSLGAAYAHLGRYEQAEAEYKLALEIRPDYAKAYYNLGLAMEKQGQDNKALEAYRQAVKLKNDYGEAHNNLGGLYLQQGLLDKAEREFLMALRLKPLFIEIRANLAALYLQKGELEKARREFIALLKQKPRLGEAHYNLATLYLKKGYRDYTRARWHLEEALRLRAKRPPPAVIRKLLERVRALYKHRNEKSRKEIKLRDGRIFGRYSAPMLGHQ